MNGTPKESKCLSHKAWTHERLEHKQAIVIGSTINTSSAVAYSSALQYYLFLCCVHDFPVDPTPDTSSFYTIYMPHHILPSSIDSYLSGICN